MSGLRSEVLPEVVGGTPPVVHPGHPCRDAARGPGFCSVQVVTGHVRARSEAQRSAAVCLSLSAAAFGLNVEECETTSVA